MREALALIPYKAAEERHWNEAEEDDEEDRPTDDTLRLGAAKTRKRDKTRREHHLTADVDTHKFPNVIQIIHIKGHYLQNK